MHVSDCIIKSSLWKNYASINSESKEEEKITLFITLLMLKKHKMTILVK